MMTHGQGAKSTPTDAQVEGIHRMVMNDRRVTVKHIAETSGHQCSVSSYSFDRNLGDEETEVQGVYVEK